MINLKKLSLPAVAVLLSLGGYAQQFQWRANLDSVRSSGFYAIAITPELSSLLKTDFSDFRVADSKGQWVPHIIRFAVTNHAKVKRINLNTASKELGSNSVYLIENPEKYLLSEFILRLKNAAAERKASVSGSDDNYNWFVIADSLLVAKADVYDRDENSKVISLPPTQYAHYKLTIQNEKKDPLNVLGISADVSGAPNRELQLVENPFPQSSRLDSGKYTLITVTHDKPYQFDQFRVKVNRPALYERTARVYLEVRPGLINTWNSAALTELRLSSTDSNNSIIPLVKSKTFYILISNEDNPPLEVNAVVTFQRNKQAIAYLEKNRSYHLLLENPQAEQPRYDLNQFDKIIPEQVNFLQSGALLAAGSPVIDATKKVSDWWIWATIGGVILLLAYLTWGLTRDMNKEKKMV